MWSVRRKIGMRYINVRLKQEINSEVVSTLHENELAFLQTRRTMTFLSQKIRTLIDYKKKALCYTVNHAECAQKNGYEVYKCSTEAGNEFGSREYTARERI